MHSSTGAPSPTCAHSDRASISTPPPQLTTAAHGSRLSVPSSPAPPNDHANEWPQRPADSHSSGNLDTAFASMSLNDDLGSVGLGFTDKSAPPIGSLGSGGSNTLGSAPSVSHISSPTLTAIASPAASASPTPTAYTTPSDSALPSPMPNDAAVPPVLPSSAQIPAAHSVGVASTLTPSPSLESNPSSVSASPTFTTCASATLSPVAKFMLSPALISPAISSPAIATSSSNHTSPCPADVVSPSFSSASEHSALLSPTGQDPTVGSPTPHATARASPDINAQATIQDAGDLSDARGLSKLAGAPLLESPLALSEANVASFAEQQKRSFDRTSGAATIPSVPPASHESFAFHPAAGHEVFQPSGGAHDMSSTLSTVSSTSGTSFKTPNVYINGLPPNFPEEQLYNMTKDFGGVVSVRTFTRHVSERPTGYGFVLFETMDGAERCIEALRKYRNLHPSLSKQIHKIPGTLYSTIDTSQCGVTSPSNSAADENSFKTKMEKLKDTTSTNLYIEGLPLSIDEPTLTALVSPYVIKSSRFFQTKLSHPPRIIAFVRLETRSACEEIIERLHGRMVRGWNDSGCRISVRFADSNEQRELRKRERSKREGGDGSPNRLTMAQAALLNLRGSEMSGRAGGRSVSCPTGSMGVPPVDTLSLAHHPVTTQYQQQRDMQLLLDSLKNGGVGLGNGLMEGMGLHGQGLGGGLHGTGLSAATLNAQALGLSHAGAGLLPGSVDVNTLLTAQELNNWNGTGSSQAGAGGFTPAEQLLLQAHAQARARLAGQGVLGVSTSASVGMAGLPSVNRGIGRAQAGLGGMDYNSQQGYGVGGVSSAGLRSYSQFSSPALDTLPTMSEEQFHATAVPQRSHAQSRGQFRTQGLRQQSAGGEMGLRDVRGNTEELDLDEIRYSQRGVDRRQTNDPLLGQRQASIAQGSQSGSQTSSLHMRATTLPASHFGNNRSGANYDGNKKMLPSTGTGHGATRVNNSLKIDSAAGNGAATRGAENVVDKDQSPLVSPALTYASHTPSSTSFSPATPYFHAGGFEGYEGVGVAVGAGDQSPAGLGLNMMNNVGKGKGRAVSHS
ncbi:hypothetical protein GLOTRDRAFT_139741 [Gloeophyllum trabeum ATCC 11539]|uniref:RRM domain-containing protein n=1 Tax=Gloeophyllum trabeum (strain ATCC 11539 / FP-39264 / Madison 617) TaxID=670483 RepID=S7Q0T6_GLOTA|nr:uncharacterized protein GLOTRDRAFT_139741 [Gloeophyllum trabeum ATCC 11539]EPQ53541.1 hypothetical protein GLOTRDRAFT_139741 [Gloeophyllum trabeum ATCC 11539]